MHAPSGHDSTWSAHWCEDMHMIDHFHWACAAAAVAALARDLHLASLTHTQLASLDTRTNGCILLCTA